MEQVRPVSTETTETFEARDRDYEVLNSPELRAKYLQLTDELICKMVENGTDVAIFLDKSARPVAWMVNKLWDQLAPKTDNEGNPVQKPEIKFLNIDREQWGAMLGRSEDKTGGINVDRLEPTRAEELRDLYAPINGYSNASDESLLTGKNVMIIDEVRQSGDTLAMSEGIIKKVFPDAKSIEGVYWMFGTSRRDKSGNKIGTEVPVWYSDRETTGRLVANRDTNKSDNSNSSRQRVGRYWLSTPFREPDTKGLQLKKEVAWLADDLRDHKLIYMPAPSWPESIDPVENRIERINGITIEEYVTLRREARDNEEFVQLYLDYMAERRTATHAN